MEIYTYEKDLDKGGLNERQKVIGGMIPSGESITEEG